MRLLVISHTEHYLDNAGNIVGLSSTVRELNHLLEVFDHITHVAPLYRKTHSRNAIPYQKGISFIPIDPTGGKALVDKIHIFLKIPSTVRIVRTQLLNNDVFQFRAPTGIGVYLIPFLSLTKKSGWFKYAGNWKEKKLPFSYRIQRFYLNNLFKGNPVTINGKWKDQKIHQITFENPCLTEEEIRDGKESVMNKAFDDQLNLLYVGRIELEKGVHLFLESLNFLNNEIRDRIKKIYIVGEGKDLEKIKKRYSGLFPKVTFEAEMTRNELNEYYRKSHFLFLPSKTEGFPKVVAEASNFGCIPCVSNVSSIGQYINESNGLIFTDLNPRSIASDFSRLAHKTSELRFISEQAHEMSSLFTYKHYNAQITNHILQQ